MQPLRVGVAMSGGVDSTLSALLLRRQGFDVHGFFMLLPLADLEDQVKRVQKVADDIDIPLRLIDLREQFTEKIINYFCDHYGQGLTPNPCVVCNDVIKFGLLFDAVLSAGMDRIATGHYAGIQQNGRGRRILLRGSDPTKDQSYFLCRLSEDRLARILFPLGERHKQDVYSEVESLGLHQFSGQESQDVCFLSSGLQAFLATQGMGEQPGDIVSVDGRVLGTHNGISRYTVGQRRGLGLPDATPWYVVGLDAPGNRVIVGKNKDLFKRKIEIRDLRMHDPEENPFRCWEVQLRSRHCPAGAKLERTGADRWLITFNEPQRAITPGQFAVLYDGQRVAGSGIITGAAD